MIDVAWRAEVVRGDERGVEAPCAFVGNLLPDGTPEDDRMAAIPSVARCHHVPGPGAPAPEHAVDRLRTKVRAVGQADDRGLDLGTECAEPAAQGRAHPPRPVG